MKTAGRILLIALIATTCAAQTVYRTTDSKGRPVFTDQPPPGAKPVELPPVNTTPGAGAAQPTSPPSQEPFSGYRHVAVLVPGSIPNGLAPVTVGIAIEPALRDGHSWQLLLDGRVTASGRDDSFTFEQLERGPHRLELKVVEAGGAELAHSEPAEVFVFWPGKNR